MGKGSSIVRFIATHGKAKRMGSGAEAPDLDVFNDSLRMCESPPSAKDRAWGCGRER